ncbi:MAG: AraC family transcriptional regulator of adaptative response / DNA-3-methyladenine glycosylase II [Desulforhopalus sp.]|jgi:AraC family transcriptional regulator of adaptative response / DNA-3-methyladenine glycosylase II
MNELLSKARILRDKNFDGKFFFGVQTTGIFCRPSCSSRVAKEENVQYFNTVFDALDNGFRPCLRCRPDIATDYYNGNPSGTLVVKEALEMIYDGYLHEHSIQDLASSLSLSGRHLRKLFIDNLGLSPGKIDRYHKVLFAKKMLLYSEKSITDVAFASGFGSLRQFNDVFKATFATPPSALRSKAKDTKNRGASLRINYKKPFDFDSILSFLRKRAIKGVENVTTSSYSRTFRTESSSGFFVVANNSKDGCLELTIDASDLRCYMTIYNRVRKMFDVDTDFSAINARFSTDKHLSTGMVDGHVPRLPVAFDPFEAVVRAILGQQISVQAATTLVGRIVHEASIETTSEFPSGLDYFFPFSDELMGLEIGDIGITKTRQETLKTVTRAVLDKVIDISINQSFETFQSKFTALKGIGDWTAHYVAMRGLGMMDCFPYNDLVVIKALTINDTLPSKNEILERGELWRPYRTYATLCLWNSLKKKE